MSLDRQIWLVWAHDYPPSLVHVTDNESVMEGIVALDPDLEITSEMVDSHMPLRDSVRTMSCVINHKGGIQNETDHTQLRWEWEEPSRRISKAKVYISDRNGFTGDRYATITAVGSDLAKVDKEYNKAKAQVLARHEALVTAMKEADNEPES